MNKFRSSKAIRNINFALVPLGVLIIAVLMIPKIVSFTADTMQSSRILLLSDNGSSKSFIFFLNSLFKREEVIVLATANSGFSALLENFLCSVALVGSPRKFLFFSEDYSTAKVAAKFGHAAIVPFLKVNRTSPLAYGTIAYQELMHFRAQLVLDILKHGYGVLIADIDSVWLKDPFPYINTSYYDVAAQLDYGTDESGWHNLCCGFLFLNCKQSRVIGLWQAVVDRHAAHLDLARLNELSKKQIEFGTEQIMFNDILKQHKNEVRIQKLDITQFPNGKYYFEDKMSSKDTAVVIHNNYIVGHHEKVKRFQENNLWMEDKICKEHHVYVGHV